MTGAGGSSTAAAVQDESGKASTAGSRQQQVPASNKQEGSGDKHMHAPSISMPVTRGATEGHVRPNCCSGALFTSALKLRSTSLRQIWRRAHFAVLMHDLWLVARLLWY